MKTRHSIRPNILLLMIVLSSVTLSALAQQSPTGKIPVSTVVSVEARRGNAIPVVNREDVRVLQGHDHLAVTDWVPLQGDQSALELFILIDEATTASVANQFEDIRSFLHALSPTTTVAVGYMQNGMVRTAQNFTADHDAAGKALRIPMGFGGGSTSPYLSITDAIKRWPESPARHEILLISDGIDPLQPGISDSYLDAAIDRAQRTGTQIYAIFSPREGHFGHSLWRTNQGQNNLSQLADETGGESYFQGFGSPVAFAPYLNQFATRLKHQYKLTFLIKAGAKPTYEHVRLETEVPNAELVTAGKVYVPAAK